MIVVLAVVLALSLDSIAKALAKRRIRAETGMDATIGRLSVGLVSPKMRIEDFKLSNTAEFGGTPFIDIRELEVEYDRAALAERKLHITLMRFNLAELNVVKNEAGQTNIFNLMSKAGVKGANGGSSRRVGEFEFTGIDSLNLSVGKLAFIDLKDPRNSSMLNLDVSNRIMKNVKSEADLYGVLLLVWLRNGGSFSGVPMTSPPQIISGPIPRVEDAAKK